MSFQLPPPHVAPQAAFWGNSAFLPRVPTLSEIIAVCDPLVSQFPIPQDPAEELDELEELASLREDTEALSSEMPGRERLPISIFLQKRPQPLGAQFNTARDQNQNVIVNGLELARWFEAETPGLGHRHALNFLFPQTKFSPPHQSRIWASLDVALYGSFLAAWHYKWQSELNERRARPSELRPTLSVIYDYAPGSDGVSLGLPRTSPMPFPGTPRHPAYPAGHSATAGAASEICAYFFPEYRDEFDKLADNSGMARLWAGIHYRSDHTSGIAMGRAVARLVIDRLEQDGANPPPSSETFGTRESLY